MSKKDTFYFSHDYNSRNDIKIKKLMSKHNILGYGVFWAIIEDLYQNANALPTDYDSIAFDLRVDSNLVKSIINDFELFVIKDGFFGSESVERRLNERSEKSLKARESANNRWKKIKEDANALPTDSDCNAIKEKKRKDIKVKDIILNTSYQLCVDFWLKEFHPDFNFNATAGKKMKSIIEKFKTLLKNNGKEITENTIFESFKIMCIKLPEWYKNKDLSVIDSKFNEIIQEIKNGTNSKQEQRKDAAAEAIRLLTGTELR